ncbi:MULTISPECIES: AAA family ATPase [Aeromonas]|nr:MULTISPECIES: AAA family ATPase [Aeromonas]MBA8781238.1 AAA family ATPase [Aeromonas caviae]MBA8785293.1 AAA family ATPase [Aeromonas sp. TW 6]
MKLKIEKLKRDNIFTDDFLALKSNNEIDFASKSICVLYGPNGTGKTSLSKVLSREKNAQYTISLDGSTFTEKDEPVAHIISDQNDRNLIQGETQDFILGDNIRREYELKERLNSNFSTLFEKDLVSLLKNKYGISTKNSFFDELILDKSYLSYISDIANNRSKGKAIDRLDFIKKIYEEKDFSEIVFDEEKLKYFVIDYGEKESAIRAVISYTFNLTDKDKKIAKLEEQNQAINILKKYNYLDDCIICDHSINSEELLAKKSSQLHDTQSTLSDEEKLIAEKIIKGLPQNDPFNIRDNVLTAINRSDRTFIDNLVADFNRYKNIYWECLKRDFVNTSKNYTLKSDSDEYQKLMLNKPEFDSEDILFIERFLNETLERKISLERDDNGNIKLLLGGAEFLQVDRTKLSLSNGEQNFLSLSFELLKAKNINAKFIVLDDPISSFDSIYKNKLAYAIISFLRGKKSVILTHNTDLIKLLEHQQQQSINLYYFNNIEGENNGFIPVNRDELKILLYIHELLDLLRDGIKNEVLDKKQFLISIAPFMRGYCQIIGLKNEKNELTKLMHGYNSEKVDLVKIYTSLFGKLDDFFDGTECMISAFDIINMDSQSFNPIKKDTYPLLSKSLRHTMNYLFLRLNVENTLVNKFNIDTKKHDLLSQIILAAFPIKGDTPQKRAHRVFFMSRKTLLNEFNHFEMDMNIFQPAIDITDKSLNKERTQIMDKLEDLKAELT